MTDVLTRLACMPESIEVREASDGHFIRGVATPYDVEIDLGDIIESMAPGVFRKSYNERAAVIGLMEQHNRQAFPVGDSPTFEESNDGLVATFEVVPTERGREALALAKRGRYGMSVGFIPVRNDIQERNGRRHVRRIEAKLDHIGLVLNPAYEQARILEARNDEAPAPFNPDNPAIAPRLARFRALHGLRDVQ